MFEDALSKFNRGEIFSNYIPNVDWNTLDTNIGLQPPTRHLISQKQTVDLNSRSAEGASLEDVLKAILHSLDVAKEDFAPILPFTHFGLDSFGATKISHALRPHVQVSQMQLLGGITWEQILQAAKEENSGTT